MPKSLPHCQIVPQPDHQASFTIDGVERLRWHFGPGYPRPFFYPLIGPSGAILTRIGHPGAPDHDHHRSIWFAHEKVLGINFWGDNTTARIRQKQWLTYQDGNEEAILAVSLGWYDGHDPKELLTQELVAAVRPHGDDETLVELQSTFTPTAESLELGQTNFGFLAVRVAKSISKFFGGGELRSSEGALGEREIFGKPARWMDYSGPIRVQGGARKSIIEGITYFDHRDNPGHPAHWHVREDGWMGASFNRTGSHVIRRDKPLVLRYLLHAHSAAADPKLANEIAKDFNQRPAFQLKRLTGGHIQYQVNRG
ncbi:MAG: PmoA family protein [Pirellulales bacterium]